MIDDPQNALINALEEADRFKSVALAHHHFTSRVLAEIIRRLPDEDQAEIKAWLSNWAAGMDELNAKQSAEQRTEEMTHQENLAARQLLDFIDHPLPKRPDPE